mgnify:FL=1
MSSPSFREPNESDEQLSRMMDEREEREWALVERIKTFSPQLAREVAEAFGLE